ncbi:hypothetical protein KM92DES2_12273 [uncultured Desulfovibrio sp.]|uniref:Uncharacterized protein n=1 Tax=uncultured Desulfovibrio sp. TaxID=167968 RepID=A0A212K5R3_9BACT|nr:hypothetical protein KM92DES2_12273 [uncultured Desulfovibrio sp.]
MITTVSTTSPMYLRLLQFQKALTTKVRLKRCLNAIGSFTGTVTAMLEPTRYIAAKGYIFSAAVLILCIPSATIIGPQHIARGTHATKIPTHRFSIYPRLRYGRLFQSS